MHFLDFIFHPLGHLKAKSRLCCPPYKVATVCLGLLCAFLVIVIIILFVYKEQVKPKVCPPEWIGFNTSCYYISSSRKSWNDSQEYCAERGGHLAIIHTPEEQTFLFNQLAPGYWNAYWFGVSDEKAEGDWFWVDGTKLVRGFWIDGEPNNNNDEDCGYMVKTCNASILTLGSWNDAPCNMSCPWICEAPIS
ncbi:perlucin-like protein isoform X2 [Anguilla rostrata]|uniref:perlucin-like protein isoform X2 n=1 Tax=Anguilla rostrata TaxID=7938 RepID=UPI0030D44FB3